MKHTHFILILATALLLCGCEQITDDRSIPVPQNPKIAWLLSVEVDKLPNSVEAYDCIVFDTEKIEENYNFTRTEIHLPELLKIPGALLLKQNRTFAVSFFQFNPQAQDSSELELKELATILVPTVPDTVINQNDTIINYPQKVRFNESGVEGNFHFRYD